MPVWYSKQVPDMPHNKVISLDDLLKKREYIQSNYGHTAYWQQRLRTLDNIIDRCRAEPGSDCMQITEYAYQGVDICFCSKKRPRAE